MNENIKKTILPYRWWWLGGLSVFVVASLLFFQLRLKSISPYRLVSDSSGLVLTIQQPGQFFSAIQAANYSGTIGKWVVCEKFRTDYQYLEKLIGDKSNLDDGFHLTLALQSSSAQTLDYLYILETPGRPNIKKILSKSGIQYKHNNFNGHTVYTAFFSHDTAFSFAEAGQMLIAARHTEMVEEALSVMDNSTGISENPDFCKMQKKLTEQPSTDLIFINAKALPPMLSSFLQPSGKEDLRSFSEKIRWVGAGYSCEKDRFLLNGCINTVDRKSFFDALPENGFYNQQRISEVLPSNTAALFWLGAGDYSKYYSKAGGDDNFGNFIAPWVGEEAACAVTEPLSGKANAEVYAVFRIKDSLVAKSKMKQLEKKQGLLFESVYNSYNIKQFRNENILSSLTGNQLAIKDPFYTFAGNYAIFCSSRAALELCIDKYLAQETLAEDGRYQKFIKYFNDKSNLFFFINLAKIEQQLKSALQSDLAEQMDMQFQAIKQMNLLGLQLRPGTDGYTFSGKWQNSGNGDSGTAASFAWKFLLDSEAATAPALTLSADGKSKEVFVQDKKNQIYVINSAGEVRIKQTLDEPILSEIRQIDYFKTGKLYYLFNTAHKIHMLDSRGNEVLHFPIVLQTPATTGMLVTDFGGGGAYNFFVPVRNGNVYGFENNGKPLAGWNPRTGVGLVRQPMKNFRMADKDYIVALSDKNLVVLKKNGELHMNPVPLSGEFLSPPGYQCDAAAQRIVVMNSIGMTTNINLEGNAFNLALGTAASRQMRMSYADVCGDARYEYISLDGNTLTCRGYNGAAFTKFFEVKSEEKIDDIFVVKLPQQEKSYIGYVSKSASRIYMINGSGEAYRNFPLSGTTSFEITDFFGDGVPSLIVANGSSVYIYKL